MSEIERRKDYPDLSKRLLDLDIAVNVLSTKVEQSHKDNHRWRDEVMALTTKHSTTLYGNGQPGLTTKIDSLKTLAEEFKDHSENDRWFQRSAMLTGVTVIGFLIKLVFFK